MRRVAALLAALVFCCAAHAQSDFPSKPVRLITPFNPGGAIDVLARVIAERLQPRLGQPVVAESIPGANTIIGTQALLRSAPDGHTFMITTMSTTVNNPPMYAKLPYDPVKDLPPITQLSYGSVLLVAPANASYSDVPAIVDVQNGNLDLTFSSPTSAKPRIAANAIKPLGMTGPSRSVAMPELATFGEQGIKGFELAIWVGAYAPGGTPKPVRERLQRELRAVINEPDVTKRMHDQGQVPIGNTPDEFMANYLADAPKWAELIRASGAKAE